MLGCLAPGAPVHLSYSNDPRRKLPWTLERIDMGAGWVGVHTGRANPVVAEAIAAGRIPALAGYGRIRREVAFAADARLSGRLDIALENGPGPDALVEVKNVTLLHDGWLLFPDAVTRRGRKHLDLLQAAVQQGRRGIILFAVNRPEGERFAPAWPIDPLYAARLAAVAQAGVEVLAIRIRHTESGLEASGNVPIDLTHSVATKF
jgi:sugar fermentation stimulation protein A